MSNAPGPGNSCGTCAVCCSALRIIELDKPAGITCGHCTGTGCGIYETRFEICRTFLCGWRQVPALGDTWRPDRSGVLILTQKIDETPPEHRTAGAGLNFVILGGEKAIQHPGFAEYVSTLVSRNVAVYISADTPKTLVNKYLQQQVAAKDKAAVLEMLIHIYRKHIELRERDGMTPMPWIKLS